MLWSRPPRQVRKPTDIKNKGELMWMGSVGQELRHLEKERAIQTDPQETRRRRTIQLLRDHAHQGSWGFTLQTYGIRNKRTREVEVMTYVDYVELHGSAWIAGMRRGDVLLSVNGESVEGLNHPQLVEKIQLSKDTLRAVVLFEDCCRKVELYERFIKLKRILSQKMRDLRQLEMEERILCSGDRLSRVGLFRDSVCSSTSSDWDCYSEVTSPGMLDRVVPNQRMWRQHFFASSIDTLDNTSQLSFDYPSPFGSSRESIGDTSRDSLTHMDSVSMAAGGEKGEKSCEAEQSTASAEQSTASAEQSNDTRNCDVEDGSAGAGKDKFYLEEEGGGGSDSEEVATLRRQRKDKDCADPPPGRRGRSNSTILNDMRMILLAEAVNTEANKASMDLAGEGDGRVGEGCQVDGEDLGCVSDSEITVTIDDEEDPPCRLYRGVRINDSDEVTRL